MHRKGPAAYSPGPVRAYSRHSSKTSGAPFVIPTRYFHSNGFTTGAIQNWPTAKTCPSIVVGRHPTKSKRRVCERGQAARPCGGRCLRACERPGKRAIADLRKVLKTTTERVITMAPAGPLQCRCGPIKFFALSPGYSEVVSLLWAGLVCCSPPGLWLANLLGIGAQVLMTRGVWWRMFPSTIMRPDDWVGSTARPKRTDNGHTW